MYLCFQQYQNLIIVKPLLDIIMVFIMFTLFIWELYSHYQSLWEDEKRRLEGLLRSKPISPSLPLVVICPVPANENVDENFVQRCLNIDNLVAEKLISCMSLYVIEYDEDLPEGVEVNDPEVTEKVRWKGRKALYQWI